MARRNSNLKAYVRYDGSGFIVPGSLVLRLRKPQNGNWQEIASSICCTTTTTTTEPE